MIASCHHSRPPVAAGTLYTLLTASTSTSSLYFSVTPVSENLVSVCSLTEEEYAKHTRWASLEAVRRDFQDHLASYRRESMFTPPKKLASVKASPLRWGPRAREQRDRRRN